MSSFEIRIKHTKAFSLSIYRCRVALKNGTFCTYPITATELYMMPQRNLHFQGHGHGLHDSSCVESEVQPQLPRFCDHLHSTSFLPSVNRTARLCTHIKAANNCCLWLSSRECAFVLA